MKQTYRDKLETRVKEFQTKIDLLSSKASESDVEAEQKVRYYKQIESLRLKQQKMTKKIEELQASGESALGEVKAGVEIALEDLKSALERAVGRFK